MTHLFMALGIVGMAVAIFALGFQSARIWMDWRDDKQLRAAEARYERHSHRKVPLARLADPTPFPGELLAAAHICSLCGTSWDMPDTRCQCSRAYSSEPPPFFFAGESELGWASESAEYELLTQTAEQPVSVTGEPPIDTGELLAITDRVESWIAQWTAQGNMDRHTIQAGE